MVAPSPWQWPPPSTALMGAGLPALPNNTPSVSMPALPVVQQPMVPVLPIIHEKPINAAAGFLALPPSASNNTEPAPSQSWSVLAGVASAAGLFLVGRLLHRLPAHHVTLPTRLSRWKWVTDVVPTDWKDWVRMFLGVGVVNHINQAVGSAQGKKNKTVPPWLVALETVAVLTPMMNPAMFSKQTWKSFLPVAIAVPPLVQVTAWAKQKLEQMDASGQANIPGWVSHTALPIFSTLVGVFGLRKYMNWSSGTTQASTSNVVGAELVCVRCGGMHLMCPTEIAEFFGGLAGGLRHNKQKNQSDDHLNPYAHQATQEPSL